MVAGATGSHRPRRYPLSSRFDENDAILVMDNAFDHGKTMLIYRSANPLPYGRWRAVLPVCIRCKPLCARRVKLDFIAALLKKSLECTGTTGSVRCAGRSPGEVVAWRNTFWALVTFDVF